MKVLIEASLTTPSRSMCLGIFDLRWGKITESTSVVKTNQMHQRLKFIYFGITPHVSEGLSIHQQEFTTVPIAPGTCQIDTASAC